MIGRIATLAILAASVSALPALDKRIAQDTITAAQPWEAACRAAGGGAQCNPIAVTAAGTLLAAPPACAQQDSADAMISLAKTLNNDPEMIRLAKIFRQQPRNSVRHIPLVIWPRLTWPCSPTSLRLCTARVLPRTQSSTGSSSASLLVCDRTISRAVSSLELVSIRLYARLFLIDRC